MDLFYCVFELLWISRFNSVYQTHSNSQYLLGENYYFHFTTKLSTQRRPEPCGEILSKLRYEDQSLSKLRYEDQSLYMISHTSFVVKFINCYILTQEQIHRYLSRYTNLNSNLDLDPMNLGRIRIHVYKLKHSSSSFGSILGGQPPRPPVKK